MYKKERIEKQDIILVTGGDSQLSKAIIKANELLQENGFKEIRLYKHNELDITSKKSIQSALQPYIRERGQYRHIVLVNTAAYTNVEKAEINPLEAKAINTEGVYNLALFAEEYGFALLHISTDYLFDGNKRTPYTEQDTPQPLSIYGQTKWKGEKELLPLQTKDMAMVIRTSWLYYSESSYGNFFLTMAKKLLAGDNIRVVNDQIGAPTYALDLGKFILSAIELFFKEGHWRLPTVHFSNSGKATWFQFTREIALALGKDPNSITPITSKEYPTLATRPPYSLLDLSLLSACYNYHPRPWQEGIKDAVIDFLHK